MKFAAWGYTWAYSKLWSPICPVSSTGRVTNQGQPLQGPLHWLLAGLLTGPCTLPYIVFAPEVNSSCGNQSRLPPVHHREGLPTTPVPLLPHSGSWPLALCDLAVPASLLPAHLPAPLSLPHSSRSIHRSTTHLFPPHTLHRTYFHGSGCFPYFKP